jgi:hypothetical protein
VNRALTDRPSRLHRHPSLSRGLTRPQATVRREARPVLTMPIKSICGNGICELAEIWQPALFCHPSLRRQKNSIKSGAWCRTTLGNRSGTPTIRNQYWRPADSRGVTSGQNASNVSGVSLRTCQGTGPFLDQSRDRGSQHRHIAYIAQYIVTLFYKDAHRAGLATFRYHFTALYRDKRLNPNSSYGRIQTKDRRRRKVTALNQPRSRQLVLDVRVVDRSRDKAGDAKGGLQDDHGKQ